ncbi:MAG: hypothetical protein FWH11_11835 [Micrococcales bacterium]|nr:hypothetical protein [Micrococcales bacterium]
MRVVLPPMIDAQTDEGCPAGRPCRRPPRNKPWTAPTTWWSSSLGAKASSAVRTWVRLAEVVREVRVG